MNTQENNTPFKNGFTARIMENKLMIFIIFFVVFVFAPPLYYSFLQSSANSCNPVCASNIRMISWFIWTFCIPC